MGERETARPAVTPGRAGGRPRPARQPRPARPAGLRPGRPEGPQGDGAHLPRLRLRPGGTAHRPRYRGGRGDRPQREGRPDAGRGHAAAGAGVPDGPGRGGGAGAPGPGLGPARTLCTGCGPRVGVRTPRRTPVGRQGAGRDAGGGGEKARERSSRKTREAAEAGGRQAGGRQVPPVPRGGEEAVGGGASRSPAEGVPVPRTVHGQPRSGGRAAARSSARPAGGGGDGTRTAPAPSRAAMRRCPRRTSATSRPWPPWRRPSSPACAPGPWPATRGR